MDKSPTTPRRIASLAMLGLILAACGGTASSAPPTTVPGSPSASASAAATPTSPSPSPSPSSAAESAAPSQPPDTGGGTTSGDVPDNAVFLTYHDASHGFSIQYVEGWQVTTGTDGVVVRDKDSSETVAVVALPSDIGAYIKGTDLPALQAQSGFKLVKQNTVKVGSHTYDHLVVHLPSPADPVTGKQIASTIDRYYVPGTAGMAIVSLSTPNGVDNVDAFRQMIESFTWS